MRISYKRGSIYLVVEESEWELEEFKSGEKDLYLGTDFSNWSVAWEDKRGWSFIGLELVELEKKIVKGDE